MAIGSAIRRAFGGGGNYAYVTARVRAKKPKLLPKEEYTKLLAMDVNEIARTIEEGEYKKEVLALAGRASGALLVEQATRLNLSNTYQDILGMCTGELRRMVLLYLQRYDVYNVKTVLRGRFAGASEEEITRNLIPAGALTVSDLEDLVRLGSLQEVIEALKRTPYGRALDKTTESLQRLTEVENALDRDYYARLIEAIPATDEPRKAFVNFLREEVDVVNVRTLLRLRAGNVEEAEDLFLPHGRDLDVETLRRLLRAPASDVAAELENTRLKDALPGIRTFLDSGDLNAAMNALDRHLAASSSTFSKRYPLSILPIVDFLIRKRREVDNLRIVAYGKATGIRESALEELVIT